MAFPGITWVSCTGSLAILKTVGSKSKVKLSRSATNLGGSKNASDDLIWLMPYI